MKKLVSLVTALIALTAATVFASSDTTPGTGIYQTAHDIRFKLNLTEDQDRLCVYCHTPHHANDTAQGPLWSHALTAEHPAAYSSPTFNAKGITITDPYIGDTRLCQSCHDGSVAVDSYYGKTGTNMMTNSAGEFTTQNMLGTNMKQSHPVGFLFSDALSKSPNLNSGLTESSPYLGNSNTNTNVGSRLFGGPGGYMTCRTCHDVHNTKNKTDASIKAGTKHYFLIGGQLNSGLCITCHNQAGDNATGVQVTY